MDSPVGWSIPLSEISSILFWEELFLKEHVLLIRLVSSANNIYLNLSVALDKSLM